MDSIPVSKYSAHFAAIEEGNQRLEQQFSAQFQKLATLINAAKTHPNSAEASTATSATTSSTQLLADIQKALETNTTINQRFDEWKKSTSEYIWEGDVNILASQRLATFYLVQLDTTILALQLKRKDYQQQLESLGNQHYRFSPQRLVEDYLPVRNKTTFPATVPDLLELITTATAPWLKSLTKRKEAIQYQIKKLDKRVEHLNSILDKLYYYLPYDIYSALSTSSNPPPPPIMSFHEPTSILPIVSHVSSNPPKPPLRLSELVSTTSNTLPTSTASSHLPQQSSAITLTQTNILQHCHQLPISSNQQRNNSDTSSDWSYPSSKSSHQPRNSCIGPSDPDQPCLCPSPPLSVHSSHSSY